MRNFITLDLSSYLDVDVQHNGNTVRAVQSQFVACIPESNVLTIRNNSDLALDIRELQMFNIGVGKLKFFGQVHHDDRCWQGTVVPGGGIWRLSYQFPVFRWLHQVLDMGTLIKCID